MPIGSKGLGSISMATLAASVLFATLLGRHKVFMHIRQHATLRNHNVAHHFVKFCISSHAKVDVLGSYDLPA